MAIGTDQLARLHGQLKNTVSAIYGRVKALEENVARLMSRPMSPTDEIDAIQGRRIESALVGTVDFTIAQQGARGNPITITVSQDGPFVATHYPMILWFPTAPANTTNLNRWRPVSTFPLPDQVVDEDIIDLAYEFSDGGSQRAFQNNPRGPVFSRPDALMPLSMPTLFSPNATLQLTPTFNRITWNSATPPTAGTLHCTILGYRIVNL